MTTSVPSGRITGCIPTRKAPARTTANQFSTDGGLTWSAVVRAGDPFLVERRPLGCVHRAGPALAVGGTRDVDVRRVRLERQRADEPGAVDGVVGDRGIR